MSDINRRVKKIDQVIKALNSATAIKSRLLGIVSEWKMEKWEEALLLQLYPIAESFDEAELLRHGETLKIMRGQNPQVAEFTFEEIDPLAFTSDMLSDDVFRFRLERTLHAILQDRKGGLAMFIREKLEDYTKKTLDFPELAPELAGFYQRFYLALCLNFFVILPEEIRVFIFSTDLIVLAVRVGFDLEEVIRDFGATYHEFDIREDTCLTLASFLLSNEAILGKKSDGNSATISYWLETWRNYGEGKSGGMKLLNFFDEVGRMDKCTAGEKEIIRALVELYTNFINGILLMPEADLGKIRRLRAEMEKQEAATQTTASGDLPWAGFLSRDTLQSWQKREIEGWIVRQGNPEDARRMVIGALRNLDLNNEIILNNIIFVNGLLEKRFGSRFDAIVYFDESRGKFVLGV